MVAGGMEATRSCVARQRRCSNSVAAIAVKSACATATLCGVEVAVVYLAGSSAGTGAGADTGVGRGAGKFETDGQGWCFSTAPAPAHTMLGVAPAGAAPPKCMLNIPVVGTSCHAVLVTSRVTRCSLAAADAGAADAAGAADGSTAMLGASMETDDSKKGARALDGKRRSKLRLPIRSLANHSVLVVACTVWRCHSSTLTRSGSAWSLTSQYAMAKGPCSDASAFTTLPAVHVDSRLATASVSLPLSTSNWQPSGCYSNKKQASE